MRPTFKVGDILIWTRYNEKLTCQITELVPHPSGLLRANLKIDGWASNAWELLDGSFIRASDAEEALPKRRRAA